MSGTHPLENEVDDYITSLTGEEYRGVLTADVALDIASIIYQSRQTRSLNQVTANILPGLAQQVIGWLEYSTSRAELDMLQRYLNALGYSIDISLRDIQTGATVGRIALSSQQDS